MLRTYLRTLSHPVALLALFALAACQAADGTTQAPDTAMVSAIMSGLGAVDPKAKPIDYKPRAPLAMPAEPTALPKPETKVAGSQSENWPQAQKADDYEAVKALYAKKNVGGHDGNENTRLTPEQARGINIYNTKPRDFAAEKRQNELEDGARMTPEEMKAQNTAAGELKQQAAGNAQDKLARRYLIEPPSEYSTPAGGAPLPEIVETDDTAARVSSEIACSGSNRSLKCKDYER